MAAVFRRVKLNNEFHSAVKFSLTKRGNEQLKYHDQLIFVVVCLIKFNASN